MRWLGFALVVSVAFVGWVAYAALSSGPRPSPDQVEYHEPESDDEKAAAQVAVVFLRALRDQSPETACRYAVERAAIELDCAGRPRMSGRMWVDSGEPRPINARVDGAEGQIWVAGLEPPGFRVFLKRAGTAWRVTAAGTVATA